jgi:hypothetical protein
MYVPLRYKNQLVHVVQRKKNRSLLREPYITHKSTLWAKCPNFCVKESGTRKKYWALRASVCQYKVLRMFVQRYKC